METSKKTPTAEKKLAVFLGEWHTTGDVFSETGQPVAKVDATDTYQWYPGQFFMLHNAKGKVSEEMVESLEIIGYDANSDYFTVTFFDNSGGTGTEKLRNDGNTWTWLGENVMGVKAHRCTATVSEDGKSIRALHEKSEDGQNWLPWMDVMLRKSH